MERINTKKRNTTYTQRSKCSQTMIIMLQWAHLCEENLTLFKCSRSTDKSIDIFSFTFYLVVKKFMITKDLIVEIKNLIVNHKSWPFKLNLDNIFYLSNINFQIFLYKCNRFLHFHMIPAALLLIISFFLFRIIFIACSLKN